MGNDGEEIDEEEDGNLVMARISWSLHNVDFFVSL